MAIAFLSRSFPRILVRRLFVASENQQQCIGICSSRFENKFFRARALVVILLSRNCLNDGPEGRPQHQWRTQTWEELCHFLQNHAIFWVPRRAVSRSQHWIAVMVVSNTWCTRKARMSWTSKTPDARQKMIGDRFLATVKKMFGQKKWLSNATLYAPVPQRKRRTR